MSNNFEIFTFHPFCVRFVRNVYTGPERRKLLRHLPVIGETIACRPSSRGVPVRTVKVGSVRLIKRRFESSNGKWVTADAIKTEFGDKERSSCVRTTNKHTHRVRVKVVQFVLPISFAGVVVIVRPTQTRPTIPWGPRQRRETNGRPPRNHGRRRRDQTKGESTYFCFFFYGPWRPRVVRPVE